MNNENQSLAKVQKYTKWTKFLNKTILGTLGLEFLGILAILTSAAFFPLAVFPIMMGVVFGGPVLLLTQLTAKGVLKASSNQELQKMVTTALKDTQEIPQRTEVKTVEKEIENTAGAKEITILVAEPQTEQTKLSGDIYTPVTLSLSTEWMLQELEATGCFDSKNGVLNLNSLPMDKRLATLEKVIHWETCALTMGSPDEFLDAVPEARERHNSFFGRVNTITSIIKFKEKTGDITDQQKEAKLNSILLSCPAHKQAMAQLWEENQYKNFL